MYTVYMYCVYIVLHILHVHVYTIQYIAGIWWSFQFSCLSSRMFKVTTPTMVKRQISEPEGESAGKLVCAV